MQSPPSLTLIRRNFLPNLSNNTLAFREINWIRNTSTNEVNQFIKDNYGYFYPSEDFDEYRTDMDDGHNVVANIDSDTLIRIVKFLKRGKAPGPDNIRNEVLRLGTTSFSHHSAWRFTSSIQRSTSQLHRN